MENTGHSGNKAEGYAWGLQYAFERPSLKLSAEVLKKYEGVYRLNGSKTIQIKSENGGLTVYTGPNEKTMLYAASETDFYITSEFFNISFKKENEHISGFNIERFGNTQFVTRAQ